MCDIVYRYNKMFLDILLWLREYIEGNEIKIFCLDPQKHTLEIFEGKEAGIREVSNKYLEYYWLEFSKDSRFYKVSMFYKDFDHDTGNIHVLPGAIQIWVEDNTKEKYIFTKATKIEPYIENQWKPILPRPYFWNICMVEDARDNNYEKIILDIINPVIEVINEEKNNKYVSCEKFNIINSNIFYMRLLPCYKTNLDVWLLKEKIKRTDENQIKNGHYKKYALYRWFGNKLTSEIISNYHLFMVKDYGCFALFNTVHRYRLWNKKYEYINELEDGIWNFLYDEVEIKQKRIGV